MDAAGQPLSPASLRAYVDDAGVVARADLTSLGERPRDEAVAFAVLGTVLSDAVVLGLRRLAQEDLARRRL